MSTASVEEARAAFERKEWRRVRAIYAEVGSEAALTTDDIERHAVAAHLLGEEAESRKVLARGYRVALDREDVTRAVRFAFWLGHGSIFTGESGQASAWFSRARTLLSERGADCVEWGYLKVPAGIEQLMGGDAEGACRTFTEAQAIGRRFSDTSLVAMAGHGRGRALVRLGLSGEGMAVLDDVMLAVSTGEVAAMIVGEVYCGVLAACWEVLDVGRAREWTAALSQWCEGQTELVPYRGPCLVHRVELMQLRGDWEDALDEAKRACEWLSLPTTPEGAGDAYYQVGELYRLRGDLVAAEEAYRKASQLGRTPDPGLALLWLARGRADTAANALRRALDEAGTDRARRSSLLAATVEVMLAQSSLVAAKEAAEELAQMAATVDAPLLHALADRARGSVLIADREASAALPHLRRSWKSWQHPEAPYEAARVRALIGAACRDIGDDVAAEMEFDAARQVFERLGAAPDLARLDAASSYGDVPDARGLTRRETEVLLMIAAGETNKAIASALVISEHTVARHVQNMLHKLGYSSRASLAAFAVERRLARRSTG